MERAAARLIAKKRDGGALTEAEIQDLVSGVVDGSLTDAQLGAFLMAVCCNGMSAEETAWLTVAMRDSGRVLRHDHVSQQKVDKHSTGGVGDKVSLLLAPLAAAAGVAVPMVSGRGLGHTGGTIDKLESLPGYRTDLSLDEFGAVLERCGYAMMAPSKQIAPADRRMYATRDVSGTVESIPLITSSILSKKLAEGIDGLVMDVKVGRASFMRQEHDARALMEAIVRAGCAAGVETRALLTDMDHPLGLAVGNALEVEEVLRALEGRDRCPADLLEVTMALAVEMLLVAGVEQDATAADAVLGQLWDDGVVRQVFAHNLELQGGDPRVLDDPELLGKAPFVAPVTAARAGFVEDVDPLAIGEAVVDLGGGRAAKRADRFRPQEGLQPVDPQVGVVLARTLGDEVQEGEPLAHVHARTEAAAAEAVARVAVAMPLGDERRSRGSLILHRLA